MYMFQCFQELEKDMAYHETETKALVDTGNDLVADGHFEAAKIEQIKQELTKKSATVFVTGLNTKVHWFLYQVGISQGTMCLQTSATPGFIVCTAVLS